MKRMKWELGPIPNIRQGFWLYVQVAMTKICTMPRLEHNTEEAYVTTQMQREQLLNGIA
jgi:hypothetical protein